MFRMLENVEQNSYVASESHCASRPKCRVGDNGGSLVTEAGSTSIYGRNVCFMLPCLCIHFSQCMVMT